MLVSVRRAPSREVVSVVTLAVLSALWRWQAVTHAQVDSQIAGVVQQWVKAVPGNTIGRPFVPSDLVSVPYELGDATDAQCVVRMRFLSVDPYLIHLFYYMRRGDVMNNFAIGQVESGGAGCRPGELVRFYGPWRQRQRLWPSQLTALPNATPPALVPAFVGPLGMPGITAYLSVEHIGKPRAGEVAYVSGAAGAVGTVAVQLFKLRGVKVIASAGSGDELSLLRALGADAVFNYHDGPTMATLLRSALAEVGASGLDISFDNIGGETLEAAIGATNRWGRVIICGAISQYELPLERHYGVRNLDELISKHIRLEGFVVDDWGLDEQARAQRQLMRLVESGELKPLMTLWDGWDAVPSAFASLYASGLHTGKLVLRV